MLSFSAFCFLLLTFVCLCTLSSNQNKYQGVTRVAWMDGKNGMRLLHFVQA